MLELEKYVTENQSDKNSNQIVPLQIESLSSKTSFKIERKPRDKVEIDEN